MCQVFLLTLSLLSHSCSLHSFDFMGGDSLFGDEAHNHVMSFSILISSKCGRWGLSMEIEKGFKFISVNLNVESKSTATNYENLLRRIFQKVYRNDLKLLTVNKKHIV